MTGFRLLACVTAVLCYGAVLADTPPPYPEFSFRRVKPPVAGANRLITVQIAPPAILPAPMHLPEATPDLAPEAAIGDLAWYWQRVSPALADSGPGRLAPAVEALRDGPDGTMVPAPRLQMMQDLARAYGIDILTATVGTRVSPALVLAVIGVESHGDPKAQSPKGATGLMQLMPDTAARFGVENSALPTENIKGGVAYLDWLMEEFGRDPVLVLASYNAGEGAVRQNNGVPPYAETRDYVPRVLAAWTVARGLCMTPPELVSDGCVFNLPGN
ncbi:lytic transglycosylase domain-containing protein [Actibacterium sp.]|uniref:lytic transglycosylase domain-containing protein n=1 Tax=Actibacterium sp. TaxID=1872125 RepID=UPI00356B42D6